MSPSYEEFRAALDDQERRRALLFRDGRPFFVLISQQFRRSDLEQLSDTATAIRRLDRHRDGRDFLRSVLRGYRIMNLFARPSTRTAESFIAAADKLGASSRLVADLRTSSFAKGETVEDSVRTLSSFFDAIVTRHPDEDFALRASWRCSAAAARYRSCPPEAARASTSPSPCSTSTRCVTRSPRAAASTARRCCWSATYRATGTRAGWPTC
jgi:hypothetical protein